MTDTIKRDDDQGGCGGSAEVATTGQEACSTEAAPSIRPKSVTNADRPWPTYKPVNPR